MPDPRTQNDTAPWDAKRQPSGRHLVRHTLPWLGALLLLGLIVWGLWPKPTAVETAVIARSPLTVRISEEGKTRIRNRYIVAAPVAGTMRRITLKAGDPVVAGETILALIESTRAPLLDPRARKQAEAVVSMHEAARRQAENALTAKREMLRVAQTERDRIRAITVGGTISASDRDRIEADAAIRAAEVRAAEFSLEVIDYELAQARAALEQPEAGGDAAMVEVRPPITGHILKVMQESETIVTPGMPLLEIGDPTDLEVEAEILSRDAVAIRPGDAMTIEQWGGEPALAGRVRRIEPAAFTKFSALGVEEQRVIVLGDLIDPPPAAKTLGDRYRVEVRVAVWHSDDALVIPAGALFRQGNEWKTFIYQNGRARLTTIEAGRSDGRFTEVVAGLDEGDVVILHPPDNVIDSSRVKARDLPGS